MLAGAGWLGGRLWYSWVRKRGAVLCYRCEGGEGLWKRYALLHCALGRALMRHLVVLPRCFANSRLLPPPVAYLQAVRHHPWLLYLLPAWVGARLASMKLWLGICLQQDVKQPSQQAVPILPTHHS